MATITAADKVHFVDKGVVLKKPLENTPATNQDLDYAIKLVNAGFNINLFSYDFKMAVMSRAHERAVEAERELEEEEED